MSPLKEKVHRLVDALPEGELETAERVLEGLAARARADPVALALARAEEDDEPDTDDRDGGLTQAREQADRGETIPHEEVKRRLGIS
jgi:hypothetical protein